MSDGNSTQTATVPEEQPAAEAGLKGRSRQRKAALILLCIFLIGGWFGLRWFIQSRTHITTDTAFIETHIHPVSPRISGTVTKVLVRDNQFVKKGDLLLEMDATDYRILVDKAEAELGVARDATFGDQMQVAVSQAGVQSARAQRDQAQLDLKRGTRLFEKEVIPKEQLERLQTSMQVAAAHLQRAEETLRKDKALAGLSGKSISKAQIRKQQAVLADSRLKLAYTRIVAPVDGFITRKGVEGGATVQAGQALMAVVPLADAWITANYKEGQLTHIRPGQNVTFQVDAYPGHTFQGQVESIMAGTGAAFSLLPPENATGNYVKVVQRIPVKILIDRKSDPNHLLRVGMSVEPTILTGRPASAILTELF